MFYLQTIAALREENATLRETTCWQQSRLLSLRDERDEARKDLASAVLSRDTHKAQTDLDLHTITVAQAALVDLRHRLRRSEAERCEADARYRDLRRRLAEMLTPMPEDAGADEGADADGSSTVIASLPT